MPIVTQIRARQSVVEIEADGATVARVRREHFARCPLSPGDEIEVDGYIDRVASVQLSDAYEAALTSLERCDRTARDLALSLRRRGYVEPAVQAVIERLTENGLIDDARYARRMAQLQSAKPVGVYAFKRKLRAKGIGEDDAQEALEAFDDGQQQAAARQAAEKLFRKYESLPKREARAKLSQALARRGFGWDAIQCAVDALLDD